MGRADELPPIQPRGVPEVHPGPERRDHHRERLAIEERFMIDPEALSDASIPTA